MCVCVCRFVNLLLSQMSMEELREEACDCLFEMVNKGMDPLDKTKLVESLCRLLQSAGFFNVDQVWSGVGHPSFWLFLGGKRADLRLPPVCRRRTWTSWPSSPGW